MLAVLEVKLKYLRIPTRCCCRHHGKCPKQITTSAAAAPPAARDQGSSSTVPSAAKSTLLQRRQPPWHSYTIVISNHPASSRRFFHSSLPTLLRQPKQNILSTIHCPYKTLQIPKDSTYAHAKKSFLKIAMKHHPDTVGQNQNNNNNNNILDAAASRRKSQEIFMQCRQALEALVECKETGRAVLKTNLENNAVGAGHSMSDEEFDSWFEKETGHSSNPFQFDLDPKVMREVADMHTNMEGSHGLDRDGGMWHLASMISNAVKSGKEHGGAESILRLEAGSAKEGVGGEEEAMGKLERRRRKENKTTRRRTHR